jgi:hypothetical protein
MIKVMYQFLVHVQIFKKVIETKKKTWHLQTPMESKYFGVHGYWFDLMKYIKLNFSKITSKSSLFYVVEKAQGIGLWLKYHRSLAYISSRTYWMSCCCTYRVCPVDQTTPVSMEELSCYWHQRLSCWCPDESRLGNGPIQCRQGRQGVC